jgi:F0F1-type ATP synthase delta subunit
MAHERKQADGSHIELPVLIFGLVEIHRLQRELESLEEYLRQMAIREPGKQPPLPRTTRLLEALAGNNRFNLLETQDRQEINVFLKNVEDKAPVIHISFAADPSSAFTAKIVAWLRTNIHPYTLLQLGLQPTIAAGCVVRTNNKYFDFSLRHRFHDQRQLLLDALGGRTPQTVDQSITAVTAGAQTARPTGAAV